VIELPRDVRDAVCAHAREGYPREVCGVLLGRARADRRVATRALRARNASAAADRFQVEPADLVAALAQADASGLELIGFYHSHPDQPAVASSVDLAQTSPWGGYSYPIVSVVAGRVDDLRSWARVDDRWVEEAIAS
jgi:proteasome lid subunit RPN8/RPN11